MATPQVNEYYVNVNVTKRDAEAEKEHEAGRVAPYPYGASESTNISRKVEASSEKEAIQKVAELFNQ